MLIADLVDFINIVEALGIKELLERKIQRQTDTVNRRHIQRFLILRHKTGNRAVAAGLLTQRAWIQIIFPA